MYLANVKIGTAYRRARRSLQCCPELLSIGIELLYFHLSCLSLSLADTLSLIYCCKTLYEYMTHILTYGRLRTVLQIRSYKDN